MGTHTGVNLLIGLLAVLAFVAVAMLAQGIGESFGHGLREAFVR